MQKFISDYKVPEHFTKFRKAQPHFVLIYGRRAEFDGDVELSKQRGALMTADDEELISFDRLHADPKLADAVTVRAIGNDRSRVVSAMPTIRLAGC